jgi:NADPH:quinone reductase-like Zn-dependent oxidoreductase
MTYASVLTQYGDPEVLRWQEVEIAKPEEGQILIEVHAAGIGPTDLKIRRGDLQGVFPLPTPPVLGFEAAGVVVSLGAGTSNVEVGDEVAVLLPTLGGYGQYALASIWTQKPNEVTWEDAAALPASAEAAVGILRQLGVSAGETVLILGGGGSVGVIAVQLAVAAGANVIATASAAEQELVAELGATPVVYGDGYGDRVAALAAKVDAVLDAAGRGGLESAIALADGADRVMTLADEHASSLGVRLSVPTPDRAPDALDLAMPLLASGKLRLRMQRPFPMAEAAAAHALLESGTGHEKLLLIP